MIFVSHFVPLAVSTDTLKKEFPFSIICAALLLVFGLDSMLGRVDSAVFIVLFAAYLGWMIRSALQARNKALSEDNVKKSSYYQYGSVLYILSVVRLLLNLVVTLS